MERIPPKFLWMFVAKGLTMLSSLCLYWVMADQFGSQLFGVFALGLLYANLLGNFSDFGIGMNGPVLYRKLQEKGFNAYGGIQQFRWKLSLLSTVVYVIFVFLFYPNYYVPLLYLIPFLWFIGTGFTWMFRQLQSPRKIVIATLVMIVFQWLGYILALETQESNYFFIAYGLSGWFGLLIASWNMRFLWTWNAPEVELNRHLFSQWPTVLGFFIGSLHTNFYYLLFSLQGRMEELGNFQAHWLLYTSTLSCGLIYNEIFSSFEKYRKSQYWLGIFGLWIFGLIILGTAQYYFNFLFSEKGYAYQSQWIGLLMVLYTVELILRIGGLQTLLLVLKTKEYLKWNSLGMGLQLGVLGILWVAGRFTQEIAQLLWVLVFCELVLLLLFYGGFRKFQTDEQN
jgi:hypothetical protein